MAEQDTQNQTEKQRGLAKSREGYVTSNKMDKTVIVSVVTKVKHAQYGKFVSRTKKYVAHDAENTCGIGDLVRIVETRPLSKTKRWRVQTVVERAA